MIEPQNTMLPVAESRPADVPQGEDQGFGAMLAQSLGLAPQVDPDAVQQINTNPQNRGQTQQDPAGGQPTTWEQPGGQPVPATTPNAISAQIVQPRAPGEGNAQGSEEQPNIEGGRFEPANPLGSRRFSRGDRGVAPLRTLPTPPTNAQAPQRPIDTIWKPSPLGNTAEVVVPDVPADDGMALPPVDPGDDIGRPGATPPPVGTPVSPPPVGEGGVLVPQPPAGPAQAPGIDPPDPAGNPRGSQPPVNADGPATRFEPEAARPGRVEIDRGGTIPEPPKLDAKPTSNEPAPKSVANTPPATPVPATPQRVELAPDRPVRLDTAPVAAASDRPATAEPGAVQAAELTTANSVTGFGSAQQTGATAAAGNTPGPSVLQPQASALAERVMQAIDLQRTQPPPRSMVVDIPELEGLRLVVSVRSAGHVSVTPAANASNPDVFAPFATDLSRVLAERGFVMNGDSRRQGYNPYDQDEAPPPRRNTGFRRAAPSDDDLRI